MKPNYVYVASSWRNLLQPGIVTALRSAGIACYNFRNPEPGSNGFSWSSIDPNWLMWTPNQWRNALHSGVAQRGYHLDKSAMDRADCCVLVLPCGRSAHLKAGYMAGQGKPVFTLALESVEPDLMILLGGPPENICCSLDDLFNHLEVVN